MTVNNTDSGPDWVTNLWGGFLEDAVDIGTIHGTRDLVDYFPVFLDLKQLLTVLPATTTGVKYKLKHETGALNVVFTNLTRATAFDYQRTPLTTGFGGTELHGALNKAPGDATKWHLTAAGLELPVEYLSLIQNNDGGVILIDGRSATDKPLVLAVEKDGATIAEIKLELRISPVEQMFRHVNLTGVTTQYNGAAITPSLSAPASRTGDPGVPWPDSLTNGKYFVFVHGYNVDAEKARGWQTEVFKRLHVLGSKARFVGVTWHGATGKDYHKAVFHAFQTGNVLSSYLSFTNGADVTVAAHSLGNMVVSQAIQDGGFAPSRYFMINAAVPIEAYELSSIDAAQRLDMTEDDWKSRDTRFFAANWNLLFASTPADYRNELTWRERFLSVRRDFECHNFYSPGEDVVADMPGVDSASVAAAIWNDGSDFVRGRGAWKMQELVKGVNWTTSPAAAFMERGQGGWDADLAYLLTPDAQITNEQLKTRPYFDEFLEADLIDADTTRASAKAGEAKVQYDLLARGLPALSYAVAAHQLGSIPSAQNFNMETYGRVSSRWPTEGHSGTTAQGHWLHSDFRNVALLYVYPMYEAMIAKGSLK